MLHRLMKSLEQKRKRLHKLEKKRGKSDPLSKQILANQKRIAHVELQLGKGEGSLESKIRAKQQIKKKVERSFCGKRGRAKMLRHYIISLEKLKKSVRENSRAREFLSIEKEKLFTEATKLSEQCPILLSRKHCEEISAVEFFKAKESTANLSFGVAYGDAPPIAVTLTYTNVMSDPNPDNEGITLDLVFDIALPDKKQAIHIKQKLAKLLSDKIDLNNLLEGGFKNERELLKKAKKSVEKELLPLIKEIATPIKKGFSTFDKRFSLGEKSVSLLFNFAQKNGPKSIPSVLQLTRLSLNRVTEISANGIPVSGALSVGGGISSEGSDILLEILGDNILDTVHARFNSWLRGGLLEERWLPYMEEQASTMWKIFLNAASEGKNARQDLIEIYEDLEERKGDLAIKARFESLLKKRKELAGGHLEHRELFYELCQAFADLMKTAYQPHVWQAPKKI